jgi:hypothetical protein
VATAVNNKCLQFVNLTFAEFLTARLFIQLCFGSTPDKDLGVVEVQLVVSRLFQRGVSQQTMRFVDGFFGKNKDKKMDACILG